MGRPRRSGGLIVACTAAGETWVETAVVAERDPDGPRVGGGLEPVVARLCRGVRTVTCSPGPAPSRARWQALRTAEVVIGRSAERATQWIARTWRRPGRSGAWW
jgi:hypothetical protein